MSAGEMKSATVAEARQQKARVTHVQFVRVHQWCASNADTVKTRSLRDSAELCSKALGFSVAYGTIGEALHDLGLPHANYVRQGEQTSIGGKRGYAIFQALEELYDSLELRTERRNAMRVAHNNLPLALKP